MSYRSLILELDSSFSSWIHSWPVLQVGLDWNEVLVRQFVGLGVQRSPGVGEVDGVVGSGRLSWCSRVRGRFLLRESPTADCCLPCDFVPTMAKYFGGSCFGQAKEDA